MFSKAEIQTKEQRIDHGENPYRILQQGVLHETDYVYSDSGFFTKLTIKYQWISYALKIL